MTAPGSFLLAIAAAGFADPTPADNRDIAIRVHEGRGIAVSQWTLDGKLADGWPVVITLGFPGAKTTTVGLTVAGKSWGEQRIDETKFPDFDVQSLGLNQIGEHVQLIFEYGARKECSGPGNLQPELTVDFTAESVKLHDDPGACPRPSRE